MTDLFSAILNMSLTASYVALAVIVIRSFLKKVPKLFSYILWLPVLIRLVFPFSFSSKFSFISILSLLDKSNTAISELALDKVALNPTVNYGLNILNNAVTTTFPSTTPIASTGPLQIVMGIASYLWIIGILVLLIYSIVSYIKVIKNVKTATLLKDNIFETDRITTPFVCGFIKPKIFIPAGMEDNELSYILEHEQTHIKRFDYIIKPFAFLVLILHWFNPLMWLSFTLMSKDMEMSCDENVISKKGNIIKASYSKSLLSLSVKNSGLIMGSPLAFGERHIKSRIKNILNYKKPAFWAVVVTIVITTVLIVGFTANPENEQPAAQTKTTYSGYDIETLIANKTPYVGNNGKVVKLIDAMPLPEGITHDTVELHTEKEPYGITINLIMKDSSSVKVDGAISPIPFYPNSILLFSLIDNLDFLEYKISDETGNYDGAIYTQAFERQNTVALMYGDVRNYVESVQTLKNLINKLNNMFFMPQQSTLTSSPLMTTQTLKNDEIEKYLESIMSSPNTASNPGVYIKAHPKEYESIILMKDEALNYLLIQFETGNNNDLRGHIMMALCKELLGDKNHVNDESLSPQEWYSQYSKNRYQKLQNTAIKFIERKGYKIIVNSGVAMQFILPQNFTEKNGEMEIGQFFYEKNEQSKKMGSDFSKELGRRVYLFGYEISKNDVREGFIFILFNDDNLIASWIDQSKEQSDLKIITHNYEMY